MAFLKRRLHCQGAGNGPGDADCWYLVFDTDTKHLCVVHEWQDATDREGKGPGIEAVELEVTAFLATREGPGQRELMRLIATLFNN